MGGNVIIINDKSTFDEKIGGGTLTVADFTATWCGPCQMIAPIFEAFSEEYSDVIFIKVDGDKNEELTKEYNITAYPTFIFFKDGKQIDGAKILGADKSKLEENIKQYK